MKLERNGTADIELELSWRSAEAAHAERFFAGGASLWRDCFRPELETALLGARAGEEVSIDYEPGAAVPPWTEAGIIELRSGEVSGGVGPERVPLRPGRFHPVGLLSRLTNFFAQDLRPARVVFDDGERVRLDMNHPLSRVPVQLRARVAGVHPPRSGRGSACREWLEEAAGGGPGMQARYEGRPTDFTDPDGLEREDSSADSAFYAAARLVGHVDSRASALLGAEYARRVPEGVRVLDLMSSVASHIPPDGRREVDGLGMNREELDANPLLRRRLVHDLNRNPEIPAEDGAYGAVICSLSWEYLTAPGRVLREAARVLAPGGRLLIGLSNRWFPPKVTRLWTRLHEFERLGLVLGQLLECGGFRDLESLSLRNWPRPEDDRHFPALRTADPVFLVAAVRETPLTA